MVLVVEKQGGGLQPRRMPFTCKCTLVLIGVDVAVHVKTCFHVLQGRDDPPGGCRHQDHVPPSLHEAWRIFLFQPPYHVAVGRAGALALQTPTQTYVLAGGTS